MLAGAAADAASYRDPSGRVFLRDGRVFRTVMPCMAEDFAFVRQREFLRAQIDRGRIIAEREVDAALLGEAAAGASLVLEHPRLPFVSYPYEWPFPALKAAALLQLDLYLDALAAGVMLSDASAYNIQFRGAQPVFIDSLSFRRYREGEFWAAHRQFCEQFLNPLLLRALLGVPHNAWYRGTLEGIPTGELTRLLPLPRRLSWNVLAHVVMPARLQRRTDARGQAERYARERKLPVHALRAMIRGLRNWIAKLEPADTGKTVWADYADDNSYSDEEARRKQEFVARFVTATRPALLWDIGCNTGAYAETALHAGATTVVGFDFDQGALERAFARAMERKLDLLPIFLDAANPPPSQGWAQRERPGLLERASADAVLALAVVHHLAIARNVPLERVVDWLVTMAPRGVVEFVPPADPMVKQLLSLREDIFPGYSEDAFTHALQQRARIVDAATVSASGRRLFWFERH